VRADQHDRHCPNSLPAYARERPSNGSVTWKRDPDDGGDEHETADDAGRGVVSGGMLHGPLNAGLLGCAQDDRMLVLELAPDRAVLVTLGVSGCYRLTGTLLLASGRFAAASALNQLIGVSSESRAGTFGTLANVAALIANV
jgi:hypothetical protein